MTNVTNAEMGGGQKRFGGSFNARHKIYKTKWEGRGVSPDIFTV